ncbi:sperm-associated antigen 1 isoform X1 [Alligator sinensis]|uniref:Sperm-associated antigen 1 isoform X1 n=2 Tax=Alligator sinensis TaxID=38654 RepID=A0A1U7SEZ3_ALLSI|nr:sperm-associated antigen 1 isoform X1 [Alligator sinensis]XP_006029330.1 sperm-associated antigen 1 isoform X1 [Alligator sinensis]XP_025066521.1 sperm-associated antigen 1 isoform X1 [Alligator sinensis]
MSDQPMPSMLYQGLTKTYQIPIGHLDYTFIEKCTDVKHLEKILKILRSGEEGYYPDLTLFCEKRIECLAPGSRALRKDKPAATAADFTTEEWEEINGEIKSWMTEMQEDYKIQLPKTQILHERLDNLPPVRGSDSCVPIGQNQGSGKKQRKKKNIPRDYREWDKFDVEKECSKIDECDEENNSKSRLLTSSNVPQIERTIDLTGMSESEKFFIANREKEKGNEAFATGDYKEAVTYYDRSISVLPTAAAYNNKAQAEIKLKDWHSALQDCEKVLDMEPGNLKALMRHATANKHLQNYQAAIEDLTEVLYVEPENAVAKKNLLEMEQKLKDIKPVSKTHTKRQRILIQDIENSDGEEERERGSGDKKTGVLVQEEIATEKSEMGNVQKKFTSKGDGSRSDDKETQNQREHTGSGAKKGTSENRTPKHLPDQEAEVNGYLNNDKKKSGNSNVKEENLRSCETVSSSSGKSISTLLPPTAAKLKSEGNELFKNGQFGEAVLKYSEAIDNVINLGVQNPDDLSILYSNRAACYLKEGNCSDCIQDCNRALELQPFSLKPLLRRAMAYESMERYRQAYVDFKTVLQIDSGIQAANDSVNRITKTLIDQDGPSWREKLSPIPVVPVSAQQHRWDGGTFTSETKQKSVTDVSGDKQLQINSEKTEERFRILKTEGNELVKKGKYNEALIKYSECMKLNSQESTVYTNRALCHLKLCKYEEAKQDCNHVLQIEDTNIKAFYRRALAYKGLQNYQASVDDLRKVLCIDPNVAEAKKELEEITQFLNPNVTTSSQQKQRKKIKIHEVTESNKQESQVSTSEDAMINHIPSEGGAEKGVPLKRSEKLLISEPSTAYDFGQSINAVNARKDKAACADLLMIINPPKLPMLLSNKLDGDTFLIFIQALECYILGKNPGLVYQHLFYLSKAERFKVVLTLLSKNEKEQVRHLFELLSEKHNHQFSSEDLESLKRVYEL